MPAVYMVQWWRMWMVLTHQSFCTKSWIWPETTVGSLRYDFDDMKQAFVIIIIIIIIILIWGCKIIHPPVCQARAMKCANIPAFWEQYQLAKRFNVFSQYTDRQNLRTLTKTNIIGKIQSCWHAIPNHNWVGIGPFLPASAQCRCLKGSYSLFAVKPLVKFKLDENKYHVKVSVCTIIMLRGLQIL